MLPLHKQYKKFPLSASGKVADLDDVLPKIREYWPDAYMEGSAGLARMYLDRQTRLFVAYAWCTPRFQKSDWNYLVFKDGHHW